MIFPMTVRYFDVDLKNPLVPRTAIVTGPGSREGTFNLEVFNAFADDQMQKGMGTTRTVRDVPFFATIPAACEQFGVKNTRFYPSGKETQPLARFCAAGYDTKAAVPQVGQEQDKTLDDEVKRQEAEKRRAAEKPKEPAKT